MRSVLVFPAFAALVFAVGCGAADADDRQDAYVAQASAGVVDTMHSVDVLLDRFREGLPAPAGMQLTSAVSGREALVRRFVESARRADTHALRAMHMDRAEFAWIYFPGSPYASEPYELPPDYVWFHTMAESNKGAARVIRLLGEKRVAYRGHRCAEEPERYGDARLWVGCTVQGRDEGGEEWDYRLFGSIIEVDGQFKFVSYANRL